MHKTQIEPAGGSTAGNASGTFIETRYLNGSPAQQLHGPHRHYHRSHGHGFEPGPGVNQRGTSLDPLGNQVAYDSPAAHWPVNQFSKSDVGLYAYGAQQPNAVHFVNRSVQDFYLLDSDKFGFRKGGTLGFMWAHPNPIFAAVGLAGSGQQGVFGKALKDKLREYRDSPASSAYAPACSLSLG